MAYAPELEKRVDEALAGWDPQLGKKSMFSGLSYFVNGNICFAIRGDEILVRTDPESADALAKIPGVHSAIMGKRVMKKWLQAGGEAIATQEALLKILTIGRDCALSLPEK